MIDYNSHSMLVDVITTISKLKLEFNGREKGVSRTLDDLFWGVWNSFNRYPLQ